MQLVSKYWPANRTGSQMCEVLFLGTMIAVDVLRYHQHAKRGRGLGCPLGRTGQYWGSSQADRPEHDTSTEVGYTEEVTSAYEGSFSKLVIRAFKRGGVALSRTTAETPPITRYLS